MIFFVVDCYWQEDGFCGAGQRMFASLEEARAFIAKETELQELVDIDFSTGAKRTITAQMVAYRISRVEISIEQVACQEWKYCTFRDVVKLNDLEVPL